MLCPVRPSSGSVTCNVQQHVGGRGFVRSDTIPFYEIIRTTVASTILSFDSLVFPRIWWSMKEVDAEVVEGIWIQSWLDIIAPSRNLCFYQQFIGQVEILSLIELLPEAIRFVFVETFSLFIFKKQLWNLALSFSDDHLNNFSFKQSWILPIIKILVLVLFQWPCKKVKWVRVHLLIPPYLVSLPSSTFFLVGSSSVIVSACLINRAIDVIK